MIPDDTKIRLVWDRFDTYLDLGAVVRGRQIHAARIAFIDKTFGIRAPVAQVLDHVTLTPWPRSKRQATLADLMMSCRSSERRAAQTVTASIAGGTAIDTARECHIYFLSSPEDPATVHLPADLPMGDFVPHRGLASWSVTWGELRTARTCADLRQNKADGDGDD